MLTRAAKYFFLLLAFQGWTFLSAAQNVLLPEERNITLAENLAEPEMTGMTITKRVDEVNLVFTVTDSHGHFVSNLPRDVFELRDNKEPPDKVNYFQQQTEMPLRVALLIDLSDSIRGRFKFEQEGAIVFFKKILRPQTDRAFVIGFDSHVHLAQDSTSDPEKLASAIRAMQTGGETSFYDAILLACKKLEAENTHTTRRAIIIISDGLDTKSKSTLLDAQEAIIRSEAVVYALSTNSMLGERYPKGDAVMDMLIGPSGGRILPAKEKSDLKQAFARIDRALRSQYAIGYHPADFVFDGRFRSVEIVPSRRGLKVQTRKGYYAPRELINR